MVAKLEKENLIKEIITDDIQKKKKQLLKYHDSILKNQEEADSLKRTLASLGETDPKKQQLIDAMNKELEQAERNFDVFKRTWKTKLTAQKRLTTTYRKQNEVMIREAEDMNHIIQEQHMRLQELIDQENEYQIMREQRKLEYQAQLEMLILETELKDREIQHGKHKNPYTRATTGAKPPLQNDFGLHLAAQDDLKASSVSKQIGANARKGLVASADEKRARNTKDISMQADSVDTEEILDHMNIFLEEDQEPLPLPKRRESGR